MSKYTRKTDRPRQGLLLANIMEVVTARGYVARTLVAQNWPASSIVGALYKLEARGVLKQTRAAEIGRWGKPAIYALVQPVDYCRRCGPWCRYGAGNELRPCPHCGQTMGHRQPHQCAGNPAAKEASHAA